MGRKGNHTDRTQLLLESSYGAAYKAAAETLFKQPRSKEVVRTAEQRYKALIEKYPDLLEGEKSHAWSNIFPVIAFYQAFREHGAHSAMEILERGAADIARRKGKRYARVVSLPGMKGLFLRMFAVGVKSSFGQPAGFVNEILVKDKKAFEFNMLKCPYQKYCELEGCPELVHIFCKNDEYAYGNLPGIRFIRTRTLGTGGELCDFKFRR